MAAQGRSTILSLSFLCLLFCLLAPVYAQTQHDLVINVIPSDGGTVKADCGTTCQYNADAWAHLLAIPNSGYVFNYWDVDCEGNNPSVRLMMTGPKTCYANFLYCPAQPPKKEALYTLIVSMTPICRQKAGTQSRRLRQIWLRA